MFNVTVSNLGKHDLKFVLTPVKRAAASADENQQSDLVEVVVPVGASKTIEGASLVKVVELGIEPNVPQAESAG
jgi:hypothetical protein